MSSIKLISRRNHLDDIPSRWRRTYGTWTPYADDDWKQRIQNGLDELWIGKFLPEDADRIIGNTSWTDFRCDICGENKDHLARIGEDPDYEARYVDLCRGCLTRALHVLPQ